MNVMEILFVYQLSISAANSHQSVSIRSSVIVRSENASFISEEGDSPSYSNDLEGKSSLQSISSMSGSFSSAILGL